MSGEVPILFVMFILITRDQLPFWGPAHTPKFKNFLVHIRTAEIFRKLPHLTFHIQKRSLAPPTGFSRYNTPRNSK